MSTFAPGQQAVVRGVTVARPQAVSPGGSATGQPEPISSLFVDVLLRWVAAQDAAQPAFRLAQLAFRPLIVVSPHAASLLSCLPVLPPRATARPGAPQRQWKNWAVTGIESVSDGWTAVMSYGTLEHKSLRTPFWVRVPFACDWLAWQELLNVQMLAESLALFEALAGPSLAQRTDDSMLERLSRDIPLLARQLPPASAAGVLATARVLVQDGMTLEDALAAASRL